MQFARKNAFGLFECVYYKKNPFFMIIPAKTVSVCSNKNSPLVLKQTKKLKRRGEGRIKKQTKLILKEKINKQKHKIKNKEIIRKNESHRCPPYCRSRHARCPRRHLQGFLVQASH